MKHIEFCDLSSELDRVLSFLAQLSEEDYGEFLWDYLGKRAALEHVFFDRYLGTTNWDDLKLKAEIWRIRKIRAKNELILKSEKKTNRSGLNR